MPEKKLPLCSCCGTGKAALSLDRLAPHCPFLYCHNGKNCPLFSPIAGSSDKTQQNGSA